MDCCGSHQRGCPARFGTQDFKLSFSLVIMIDFGLTVVESMIVGPDAHRDFPKASYRSL